MTREELIKKMEENSLLEKMRMFSPEDFLIHNAGLCLFGPWLLHLMTLAGYLDESKKAFKDLDSKIRAVFLLQYLTCSEDKEYRETELRFNRVLVDLPEDVSLPVRMELTAREKHIANRLLTATQNRWPDIKDSSARSFQLGFIIRAGYLEQQAENWLLTVENKPIDLLLDSVSWKFRQIHLPWLKKGIQVSWREKQ